MLLSLIVFGCGSRLLIADFPNFKPLAAIALFSGFYFRSLPMAFAATALSLLLSDALIGSYPWPIAISVYGSLLVGCVAGRYFIGSTSVAEPSNRAGLSRSVAGGSKRTFTKSAAAALAMSCLFFVITNFAVWASGSWYPTSTAGLIACYSNAVPFFKYTVAGDLTFTLGLFGSYALFSALVAKPSPASLVELK